MEIYKTTKNLYKECKEMRTRAMSVNYEESKKIRAEEDKKYKKLMFLRGLENAMNNIKKREMIEEKKSRKNGI